MPLRAPGSAACLAGFALLVSGAAHLSSQDFAVQELDASPRHHEWVEVPADGRTVHGFVAHPGTDEPAPAVIVIHENRGLTDWVRMERYGKSHDTVIYEGVGHAFMRRGADPEAAAEAREANAAAFRRVLDVLARGG